MSGMNAGHLIKHAEQCEAQAKTAREFAAQITAMGEPLGQGVVALATTLHRHGLCVVNVDALRSIRALVDSVDPAEADHPREVADERWRLLDAIDQSLTPPSTPI